jgi:hypothetical protein
MQAAARAGRFEIGDIGSLHMMMFEGRLSTLRPLFLEDSGFQPIMGAEFFITCQETRIWWHIPRFPYILLSTIRSPPYAHHRVHRWARSYQGETDSQHGCKCTAWTRPFLSALESVPRERAFQIRTRRIGSSPNSNQITPQGCTR